MRWLLIGAGCAALAGCSRASEQEASSPRQAAANDAPATEVASDSAVAGRTVPSAPGIDVTAAPGVAFMYQYGFRLPAARIAGVQEAHAQACEKLGVARCRIVGMRYRLLGENNIEALLAFKLAPALARGFGKGGITAVERAGGTLVDAEITGTDAGAAIDRAGIDQTRADDERRRLDTQLAKARTAAERAELQAQRADAARRMAAAADSAADARESLAQTPVTFGYGSGPAVRGFDTSAPLTSALDTGVASAQATLAVLLGILAIFGPPALVLGLVAYGVLRLRAARQRRSVPSAD